MNPDPSTDLRTQAKELLQTAFQLNQIEFRVDLPIVESKKCEKLLKKYRIEKEHPNGRGLRAYFELSSWDKRYDSRYYLHAYQRTVGRFKYLRVEMLFLFPLADGGLVEIPDDQTALELLWPKYLENLEKLRHYGRKDELSELREFLLEWQSIEKRAIELDLPDWVVDRGMFMNKMLKRKSVF